MTATGESPTGPAADNAPEASAVLAPILAVGIACMVVAVIGMRYARPELLSGLGLVRYPSLGMTLAYALFVAGAACAVAVDLRRHIIPNEIALGGIPVGMLLAGLVPSLHATGSPWAAVALSFWGAVLGMGLALAQRLLGARRFGEGAVGYGDVKYMGAVGAFLGWRGALFTFAASLPIAGLFLAPLLALRRVDRRGGVPFAPFLSLAAVVWVLWGANLWRAFWYGRAAAG